MNIKKNSQGISGRRKIFWSIVAIALFASCAPFSNPPNAKAQTVDLMPLKKAKKNYYSFRALDISGDASNADAAIVQAQNPITIQTYFYRRTAVPKMNLSNLLNLRYYRKNSTAAGFEEENWSSAPYFVSQGALWNSYGSNIESGGNTTYISSGGGNYNYFQYLGALNKKKKKRDATKIYSFNVSGDETNADAIVELTTNMNGIGIYQYYKKYAIPEIQMANLPDYRLYRKNTFVSGFDEESWSPGTTNYFITDGYIWIAYGGKITSGAYSPFSGVSGDYRVYLYSTPKKAKKKLKRQYKKVYQFDTNGNASNADKTTTSGSGPTYSYYYRKLAVPEIKITNMPNVQFMKKNNFVSGFQEESWSPNNPRITEGNIWAYYGQTLHWVNGQDFYTEQIQGDYRVFLYN